MVTLSAFVKLVIFMIYTQNEIKDRIIPIFEKHKVKKAYLFGSYAKGEAGENSDIDILVESKLRGIRFYGLLEALTETLEKDIDLIDVRELSDDSPLHDEIKKTGVLIYEQERQRNIA